MGFKLRPGISAGNVTFTPGTNPEFTGSEDHPDVEYLGVGQKQFPVGSHTWTVPNGVRFISAVLVGGGGGGGGNNGNSGPGSSGGGGGGLRWINNLVVTPGEVLNVVVGAGGAAGTPYNHAYAGGSSYIKRGSTTLVTASGGGRGLSNVDTGSAVASGGSGSTIGGNIGGGNGGRGGPATTNSAGSGGGGAGGNGNPSQSDGTAGTANTGGGGGAGGGYGNNGANGGSGIVIIRYS